MIDKLNYCVGGREKHKRKREKNQKYIWFFAYITGVYYYHKQKLFFCCTVCEFILMGV
jgi:hypothetical protein